MPSPLLLYCSSTASGTTGPLTVAQFVENALYHEELGYYARAGRRSGRDGDFFTSVDLGPMFGELLEAQFEEMWRVMSGGEAVGEPATDARFDLVEAAAGNGRLARDILDRAAARLPGSTRPYGFTSSNAAPWRGPRRPRHSGHTLNDSRLGRPNSRPACAASSTPTNCWTRSRRTWS